MLIMFRVKNFASFKDEAILDLRAVSYKNMKGHVIEADDNKILKTLAIFGKNASGKSNLISALYFFESFVFNQFYAAGEKDEGMKQFGKMKNIRYTPFRLSEEQEKEADFEIVFYYNGTTYQYGFTFVQNETNEEFNICNEWLLVNNDEVFDREGNNIRIGKRFIKELKSYDKARNDRLYIGVLDYFAEGKIREYIDGFKSYLKRNFNVHFEIFVESSVKGMVSGISISNRLFMDKKYKETIELFLKTADVGISGLEIIPVEKEDEKKEKGFKIKTLHDVHNREGKIIRKEQFDLNMESSGTIRYFSFIQYVLNMIEYGGVFIVDELSARLHPVLTKFIVDLFQSKRNSKAQLIFTTHDLSLMNKEQMRRDEVAFVDKNKRGESTIYTLADIKIRSDASFSKDYLYGKYGAIPMVKRDVLEDGTDGDWIWED